MTHTRVFVSGFLLASCLFRVEGEVPAMEELIEGFRQPQEDSIFMGTRLTAVVKEAKFEVVGVGDSGILVRKDGKKQPLQGVDEFFFKRTIRYSDRWVRIGDLKVTPFNTEAYRFIEQNRTAVALQMSQQDIMQRNMMMDASATGGGSQSDGGTASVEETASQETQDSIQGFHEASTFANQTSGDLGKGVGGFDALRISMLLEPDRAVEDCYLFLVARYKTSDRPGAQEANHLGLHKVGDLEPGRLTRALFAFKGFPKDPVILDMQYHFFTGNEEIPSNYSFQRILVEEDQAFDFIYADFVSKEHEGNREPRLFRKIPVDKPGVLQGLRDTRLSLKVLEDGSAKWLDPQVEDPRLLEMISGAVEASRFLPAIREDQLAEEAISIRLGELVQL